MGGGYTWSDLLAGDWPTAPDDRALYVGLGVAAALAVVLVPLGIFLAVVRHYLWTVAANAFYFSVVAVFVAVLIGFAAFVAVLDAG